MVPFRTEGGNGERSCGTFLGYRASAAFGQRRFQPHRLTSCLQRRQQLRQLDLLSEEQGDEIHFSSALHHQGPSPGVLRRTRRRAALVHAGLTMSSAGWGKGGEAKGRDHGHIEHCNADLRQRQL